MSEAVLTARSPFPEVVLSARAGAARWSRRSTALFVIGSSLVLWAGIAWIIARAF